MAVGVVLVAAAGCGNSYPEDRVTQVDRADPKMNAAIDKARSTVQTFIAALNAPKPDQSSFTVKMPFVDGEKVEHMWLNNVNYDGTHFHGTVNNDPESVHNVKIGQRVTVAPKDISDWMYIDNRKLVGGWSVRVLRDGLPPDERAEFEKSLPFVID